MDKFLHFYYDNSTAIGTTLLLICFVAVLYFYYKKTEPVGLWKKANLLSYWIPFVFTLISVILIDVSKDSIISFSDRANQTEIQNKWYFILLTCANSILLLVCTLIYFIQTKKINGYYRNYLKKDSNNSIAYCCIVSLFINAFMLFFIFLYIMGKEKSFDVLVLTQIVSILNMAFYFLIDFAVYKQAKAILNTPEIKNNPTDIQVVGDFCKTATFAMFNIDFACFMGVFVVIIIQNELLEINDTVYEYPFAVGGVFFQIVITQLIFALYQSKRLTNK